MPGKTARDLNFVYKTCIAGLARTLDVWSIWPIWHAITSVAWLVTWLHGMPGPVTVNATVLVLLLFVLSLENLVDPWASRLSGASFSTVIAACSQRQISRSPLVSLSLKFLLVFFLNHTSSSITFLIQHRTSSQMNHMKAVRGQLLAKVAINRGN